MTDPHEEQAEALEREADELRRRSRQLGDQIDEAQEDWANKQRDDSVPGATGEPRDPEAEEPWEDE
jgi:hypothetical protein